jgi:hypothetical protein
MFPRYQWNSRRAEAEYVIVNCFRLNIAKKGLGKIRRTVDQVPDMALGFTRNEHMPDSRSEKQK